MLCSNCTLPGSFACTKCKGAHYCGKACQKKHWKKHKNECCCSVCLGSLNTMAVTVKLHCGHTFHKECSVGLEHYGVSCPLCEKTEFTECLLTMKSDSPDFKQMEVLAEKGDVQAQYFMAQRFKSTSHPLFLKWYTLAAEQGHKEAQNDFANLYRKGDGVKKDVLKAAFWSIKAADQGVEEAQKYAALHLFFGEGCDVDKARAATYYELASKHCRESAYTLGVLLLRGDGVEKNEVKAREMFFRAGEHEMAYFFLGIMYSKGEGIPANPSLSVKFFKKASDMGNIEAAFNLGVAHLEGRGVAKNEELAVCFYMQAATKGLAEARFQLGLCCLAGQGIEKSLLNSEKWFRLAAEQDHSDAQFCLGRMLFDQNSPEAMSWIGKAADNKNEYALMVLEEVKDQFENVETFQQVFDDLKKVSVEK